MNKLGRFKRTLCITITAASVIVGSANLNTITAYAASGTVTATVLNVRSGGSTSDSVVTTISKGTAVEILSTSGDWYQVSVNGVKGYVHSSYVSTGDSSASTASGSSGSSGTVNVSALNLRSSASTSASKSGLVYKGQTVTILSTEGSWYKVSVNGTTAYVYAEYISVGGTSSSGGSSSTASGTAGTCNVNQLNVRSSASTSSSVKGQINKGTAVTILETSGDWYKVTTTINGSSATGYVYKTYITTSGSTSSSGSSTDASITEVNETVWATTAVNIRSGSSTSASILGGLAKNASITRTGVCSNGWSRVSYNGGTAYIHSDYLTKTNPGSTTNTSGVTGQQIATFALKYVGYPYVYGGNSLTNGVDCSGFVQQVYLNFGIKLSRVADAQKSDGTRISASNAQPGDLFFYGSSSYASHVGIYIGDGKIVHAASSSQGIITSNAYYKTPVAVVRILN